MSPATEGVTKFGGQEEDKAKIDVDLKIVSSGSCGATPRLLRRDSTQNKPQRQLKDCGLGDGVSDVTVTYP